MHSWLRGGQRYASEVYRPSFCCLICSSLHDAFAHASLCFVTRTSLLMMLALMPNSAQSPPGFGCFHQG